jgi:glycosyltransferase involved in cell wall biosynthesis
MQNKFITSEANVLFSIVIPLYNKEKYIRKTLNSVLAQTYIGFEVIVVDDGSTDGSAVRVKSINDSRIRYFYKENGGVSSARNYGIWKANGEWIYFLDADDVMFPNALEKLYNALISYKGHLDIISGSYRIIGKGKCISFLRTYEGLVPNNYKWYFLNRFYFRQGCAIVYKRILYDNMFDESLSRYEDMDWILRILRFAEVYVIPDLLFEYCCDNGMLSIDYSNKKGDFTFSMNFNGKSFWEKCKLGELLMLAFFTYPNERKKLLLQYKWNVFYALIAKIKTSLNKRRWKRLLSLCCCSSRK